MRHVRNTFVLSALLATFAAGCTATPTTKTAGEQLDDSVLTARVKTALARDVGAGDAVRTDVETYRGRVQLNGFVDSAEKKAEATRSAKSVPGVVEVENNLRVATEGRTAGEYVDDNVITARIKTALASDPGVAAHNVNIAARQGVVQLAGFVDTEAQKDRAGQIAKEVTGVTSVDNRLEVKQR